MDYRTLAAAVLGVGLGAVLVAYPEAVVRVHTVGRVPGDRRGEYGSAGESSDRIRLAVRLLGVACVALGAYFGWTLL